MLRNSLNVRPIKSMNVRGLNVRGLNVHVLGHGAVFDYTPSPTPTPTKGIYLCVAESDPTQYQRYRLADGKYYKVLINQ